MDISALAVGLSATGNAIQRQQLRFDQRAEQTVVDAQALADPEAPGDSSQLISDVVGLKTDSLVNSILFSVFRAQADQQREVTDLLKPRG